MGDGGGGGGWGATAAQPYKSNSSITNFVYLIHSFVSEICLKIKRKLFFDFIFFIFQFCCVEFYLIFLQMAITFSLIDIFNKKILNDSDVSP